VVVEQRSQPKKGRKMNVPATDFGAAGVIRRKCDRCNNPILLCWKGRDGEYCSNTCKKLAESGDKTMTDTTEATATAASPIVAGKPATKKAPKKAAAKKAAPKKAAKKAAASNGSGVIAGKRDDLMKVLKKGATAVDIAKELGWSESTAKIQISRLKRAEGVPISLLEDGRYRLDK